MVTRKIFLRNSDEVVHLLGQQDENLRRLERDYGVQVFVRQGAHSNDYSLVVRGAGGKVDKALAELDTIRERRKDLIHADEYDTAPRPIPADADTVYITFQGKAIKPRSEHQKRFIDLAHAFDMVFAVGPAGTGKTFLAVALALEALQTGKITRIVLTRPVVEAGERLGFLPGDLYEKINPYLKPLYDAFYTMLGPEKFRFMRDEDTIEIVPLAYMRGRTLENAFMILDEAQNTTVEQMKMFLTRMGQNSQVLVTGDVTQIDLEAKKQSGLVVIEKILAGVDGIKFMHFTEEDVVRHGLVKKIVKAFEEHKKAAQVP